jgi:hypothetical protein
LAQLVATLASTHHPFYLKATTMPPEQQMPQAPEWKRKIEAYRETLARTKAGHPGDDRLGSLPPDLPRQLSRSS